MVQWDDAESVEREAAVRRVFGRIGFGSGRRLFRVCTWNGDVGIDLFAVYAMRRDRVAAYVWVCAANGRDGARMDDG
jgi:hypothetical protein